MNNTDIFYKPLKISDKEDKIFFWSDLHYGHDRDFIWGKRNMDSVVHHDVTIQSRWAGVIGNDAIVFHLGDIMFGNNGEQRLFDLLNDLPFRVLYLMPGNHHAGWKQLVHLAGDDNTLLLDEGKTVHFIPNYIEAYVNGQAIVLSHYPIASWNGIGKGSWMIHGHCHGSLYNGELGSILYKSKIIDVGIEVCSHPMSFKNIKDKFKDTDIVSHDHHGPHTNNPF